MLQAVPSHKPRHIKQREALHVHTRETTGAVEWLALLEALGSSLDPKTAHPEDVCGFA
jgi:hypothetical protein